MGERLQRTIAEQLKEIQQKNDSVAPKHSRAIELCEAGNATCGRQAVS
jgi:hypothetical protein